MMGIWVAIVALVTAAALAVVLMRRNRGGTVVLGRELAAAHANEARRLADGSGARSPMPKGGYDEESGDYDLSAVTERPLDTALRFLVRGFKGWTAEKRAEARSAISMGELYTLINFAKRCAVLALKEHSIARAEDGLLALALIDETRIDPRDGAWAAGLLAHALEVTGADKRRLVSEAAAVATAGMAKILSGALRRSGLSQWGYAEIRTTDGEVGLIRSGSARYEPTFDMTGLALRLAGSLQRGRYVAHPELAADVPAAWFEEVHRSRAERLLKTSRGGIAVHGRLRRAYTDKPFAQMFVQWVVEMPGAEEANALVECVGVNRVPDGRFVIGVSSGRLFSLLVAGSAMQGVDPVETPESLASIASEAQVLLQEASAQPGRV